MIYVGKHFTARLRESRIVPCTCEKCQTDFYYELIRESISHTAAPYNIGVENAAERAEKRVRESLAGRMKTESEPVACPRCHWVNESLISGYRQSCYRGLTAIGIIAGFSITLLLFVTGSMDAVGRQEILHVLFRSAIIGGAVLAILVGLQITGRRRFRPNQTFPASPKLPPGTPIGWTREPAGAMQKSSNTFVPPDQAGFPGWVVFRNGHLILPDVCCQCLAPATGQMLGPPVDAPICDECKSRLIAQQKKCLKIALARAALLGAAVFTVVFTIFTSDIGVALSSGGLTVFFSFFGFLAFAVLQTRPFALRHVDRARLIMRIRFRNEQYTNMVRKATVNFETARIKEVAESAAGAT